MADNQNLPAQVPAKRFAPPKLIEIVENTALSYRNDEFKTYLNQDPPKQWLKEHPTATKKIRKGNNIVEVPAEFIPIDKHEIMLDTIFPHWKAEILREGTMFHSIYAIVRVHYVHPVTGEWLFHDGGGAIKAQSDAKKEFSADTIKAGAVQMGLPAAISYAIKDACEHLGKLFGRDINRADTLSFEGTFIKAGKPQAEDKSEQRLIDLINQCSSRIELIKKVKPHIVTDEQREAYDKRYAELK